MYINDIDTFKTYESVASDFTFSALEPYRDLVIEKYLKKWFSKDLMDQIQTLSVNAVEGSIQSSASKNFLGVLARFTLFEYIPIGEVIIGSSGITRKDTPNAKSAYANQIRNLKFSLENNAFFNLNNLVDILNANQSTFTEWPSSPGSTLNSKILIRTSREFSQYESLHRPFVTFSALIPAMITQQDMYFLPLIDSVVFEELIENSSGLATDKVMLRETLVKSLVNFSMALAIEKGMVRVSAGNVMAFAHDSAISGEIENNPNSIIAANSIRKYQDLGERYLDRAIELSPSSFPGASTNEDSSSDNPKIVLM